MAQENKHSDQTRDRLLDAAERLFAQKGYNAVSVREITKAAGTSLAAVNYHFRSKKELYMEVFRQRWQKQSERLRAPMLELKGRDDLTPELVVRTIIKMFLETPVSDEERHRHGQLIMREMVSPTEVFEIMIEKQMRPFVEDVSQLLARAIGLDAVTDRLRLCAISLMAQGVYFNSTKPAVSRITGRTFDDAFIAELVEHVTRITMVGIAGDTKL
jgi:AcrR family transcriptional regulator